MNKWEEGEVKNSVIYLRWLRCLHKLQVLFMELQAASAHIGLPPCCKWENAAVKCGCRPMLAVRACG